MSDYTPTHLEIPVVGPDGRARYPKIPIATLCEAILDAVQPSRLPGVRGPLRAARQWHLVLSEKTTEGPPRCEIERALAPLADLRGGWQPLSYDPPPNRIDEEAYKTWEEHHADPLCETECALLLAGSPRDLPFALQQYLALNHSVGRVSFSRIEDYAAYAEKVVESSMRTEPLLRRGYLAFAPDFDKANRYSLHRIVKPVMTELTGRAPGVPARALMGSAATRAALLESLVIRENGSPSLFFSATHGAECPDPADPDMGALCAQDRQLVRGSDFCLAEEVLPDGVAVIFACHGMGTSGQGPLLSLPGSPPPPSSDSDHVSSLASTLLGHPRGPLALVGHVDRTYSIGLRDADGRLPTPAYGPGISHIRGLLRQIAAGETVAQAMWAVRHKVAKHLTALKTTLMLQRSPVATPARESQTQLVNAWTAWNDARCWVVMGDPMVGLGIPARAVGWRMQSS